MNWLFATCLYCVYQYFFRFQSVFTKDYDHKSMFDLKNSMDFLRYTEFEMSTWNLCVYPIIEMISRMTWKKAETFDTYDYWLAGMTIYLGFTTLIKFIRNSHMGSRPEHKLLVIAFNLNFSLCYGFYCWAF